MERVVNRWMWTLECTHKVLCDSHAPDDAREFCPGCGFVLPVIDSEVYFDEEGAAWRP
jgi:hypothetical protein